MTVTWQGVEYEVPEVEPPQQRDESQLSPVFNDALDLFISHAQPEAGEWVLHKGEMVRTLERQIWLYSRARVPDSGTKIRSNTLASRHRWGLACDLYALHLHDSKVLNWEDAWWAALLERVPPRFFGLRDIAPLEYVHLELAEADLMIARAADFGLVET